MDNRSQVITTRDRRRLLCGYVTSSHAWATDTATEVTITAASSSRPPVEVSTLVAEPGPLIAMKLQAIMSRTTAKQGTDLQDIAHLILDEQARPTALAQLGACGPSVATDIALHVDLWLVNRRRDALRWIHDKSRPETDQEGRTCLGAPLLIW